MEVLRVLSGLLYLWDRNNGLPFTKLTNHNSHCKGESVFNPHRAVVGAGALIDLTVIRKVNRIAVLQSILTFQIDTLINYITHTHIHCNTAQPLAIAMQKLIE